MLSRRSVTSMITRLLVTTSMITQITDRWLIWPTITLGHPTPPIAFGHHYTLNDIDHQCQDSDGQHHQMSHRSVTNMTKANMTKANMTTPWWLVVTDPCWGVCLVLYHYHYLKLSKLSSFCRWQWFCNFAIFTRPCAPLLPFECSANLHGNML